MCCTGRPRPGRSRGTAASPDLPVPILETALRAGKVGPPRGAPPPRVGAGQSLVTVAEDVAQEAGGDADTLPEDAGEAASVRAVDAKDAWWCGASGGGDAGGGDTLAAGSGGGGGDDRRGRESWASGRKTAGSCSVAGPGAAHGSDSGSTEESSGATVAAGSGGGGMDVASGETVGGASEGGRRSQGAGEGGRGRLGGVRGTPNEEASNDATVTQGLCSHRSQVSQKVQVMRQRPDLARTPGRRFQCPSLADHNTTLPVWP